MEDVIVIRNGHARRSGSSWNASSTVTLLRTGAGHIVVDPGCSYGLERHLARAKVAPGEVGMVFITHGHPDHYLNAAVFKRAKVLDGTCIYTGDLQTPHCGKVPGTDVRIVSTPGHTPDHASLVLDGDGARYLIAGDLFWWEDGTTPPVDIDALVALPDGLAHDPKALRFSRLKALEDVDIIVPGHGSCVDLRRSPQ